MMQRTCSVYHGTVGQHYFMYVYEPLGGVLNIHAYVRTYIHWRIQGSNLPFFYFQMASRILYIQDYLYGGSVVLPTAAPTKVHMRLYNIRKCTPKPHIYASLNFYLPWKQ